MMTGEDGAGGPKAFYIRVESKPGRSSEVMQMLCDILTCVQSEPATGPWFALRFYETVFAIGEAFPDRDGRQAHVDGGGGDIFRGVQRMNHLLVQTAHVVRLDVLFSKNVRVERSALAAAGGVLRRHRGGSRRLELLA